MSYFLSEENHQIGKQAEIAGSEFRHLVSRRVKAGENFNFQGKDEKRFECEVVGVNKKVIMIKPLQELTPPEEPKVKIDVYQAVVNEQALDFIFQKSTELGANKIILFNSENTATKLSKVRFDGKRERWEKILQEAAKQCDRVRPPKLEFLNSPPYQGGVRGGLTAADDRTLKGHDKVYLLDPNGERFSNLVQSLKSCHSCSIITGPEGGFTEQEVSQFKTRPNIQLISLGPILLRAETASLAALATIRNLME